VSLAGDVKALRRSLSVAKRRCGGIFPSPWAGRWGRRRSDGGQRSGGLRAIGAGRKLGSRAATAMRDDPTDTPARPPIAKFLSQHDFSQMVIIERPKETSFPIAGYLN
jgi:hypothetical protein